MPSNYNLEKYDFCHSLIDKANDFLRKSLPMMTHCQSDDSLIEFKVFGAN